MEEDIDDNDDIENAVVPYSSSGNETYGSQIENTSQNLREVFASRERLAQYTGSVAREITNKIAEHRRHIAELKHELDVMDSERMTAAQNFAMVKPAIEHTQEEIKDLLQMMKTMDLNNLSEKAFQAYQTQMAMIAGLRQQIMGFYEKVLG